MIKRTLIVAAFAAIVLAGCFQGQQDAQADNNQPQVQQVSDQENVVDQGWDITAVTPSGLIRTYTSTGQVIHDANIKAYYFEDANNLGKRTYISDNQAVTMVEAE
jgi:ABC-type uncharacterized transport system auxiliary subunit